MANEGWVHAQAYVDLLYGEVASYVPLPLTGAQASAEVVEAVTGRVPGEIVVVDEPRVEFVTDWALAAA